MREPPWKKLVDELTARGYQSPYLERLRSRLGGYYGAADLEQEIIQEMASALGRTEEKVNLALLELELIDRRIAESVDVASPAELDALYEAFESKRQHAMQCVRELLIHREAIGFRRNEILRELYPIPPRKQRRGAGA